MSRLIQKKIILDKDIKIDLVGHLYNIIGPLGVLAIEKNSNINILQENNICSFKLINNDKVDKAQIGTFISNFNNSVTGVSVGHKKTINLVGVGYKVTQVEDNLYFNVGYSHPVVIRKISDINLKIENANKIFLTCIDKKKLGIFCSNIIKKTRKIEPYKGKGVSLEGQFILRKEGKKK